MLIVLSPAKNLDFAAPPSDLARSRPRLVADVKALSGATRRLKAVDLKRLMDLSDKLADLNRDRFLAFDPEATGEGTVQAALAFAGDVYKGLDARAMSADDLASAQGRVRILSGLYGLLRPLDEISPHRLEMGTRLPTRRGESLYDFWGPRIAKLLAADLDGHAHPVIVNCASGEYFRAVERKALKRRVVTCTFKEVKDGEERVVSFFAKHARGLMARHATIHRIDDPEGLKDFTLGGYRFQPGASTGDEWVFTRPQPDAKAA